MGAVVEAKLSFFYFFGNGPLRPERPVEVVELPRHRLRRHTSWWLGEFGTPGPCRDGACAGPSVTAQNEVLTQASCSRGFHGHVRPACAPRVNPFPTGMRRPLGRTPHGVWRSGEGFGPIWVASSVDEDTSGSLPEFVDAANDVQSTGTILEDGAAPGYCDVGSPETAGGHLGCSDDGGSNHVAALITSP